MKRTLGAAVVAAAMAVGAAAPAAAAPDNKNTGGVDVVCDGLDVTHVSFIEQANGAAAFLDGGGVAVARGFTDNVDDQTFTVVGSDPVVSATAHFTDPGGINPGGGAAADLVACSFSATFSDAFTLDADGATFLNTAAPLPAAGDWNDYVGETIMIDDTFSGVAHVMIPGSH